jgi:hypothetical protein
MNRRKTLQLGLMALLNNALFAEAECCGDSTRLDRDVHRILDEVHKLKPGMTRADLERIAGGKPGPVDYTDEVFQLNECPYIRLHVTFDKSAYLHP